MAKKPTAAEKKAAAAKAKPAVKTAKPADAGADATVIVKAIQSLTRAVTKFGKIVEEKNLTATVIGDMAHVVSGAATQLHVSDVPMDPPDGPELAVPVEVPDDTPDDEVQESDITKEMVVDAVRAALTGGRRDAVTAALAEIGADNMSGVPADRYEWLVQQVAE